MQEFKDTHEHSQHKLEERMHKIGKMQCKDKLLIY
jgi:hypothetical protein